MPPSRHDIWGKHTEVQGAWGHTDLWGHLDIWGHTNVQREYKNMGHTDIQWVYRCPISLQPPMPAPNVGT